MVDETHSVALFGYCMEHGAEIACFLHFAILIGDRLRPLHSVLRKNIT